MKTTSSTGWVIAILVGIGILALVFRFIGPDRANPSAEAVKTKEAKEETHMPIPASPPMSGLSIRGPGGAMSPMMAPMHIEQETSATSNDAGSGQNSRH